jgi:hypothetical protein
MAMMNFKIQSVTNIKCFLKLQDKYVMRPARVGPNLSTIIILQVKLMLRYIINT